MYGNYPYVLNVHEWLISSRNMMNQPNYPPKPQQDTYTPGMQQNRMMDHEMQQNNTYNNYNQRNSQMNSHW